MPRAATAFAAAAAVSCVAIATPLAALDRLAEPAHGASAIGDRATMIALVGLALIVAGSLVILDDGDDPLSP